MQKYYEAYDDRYIQVHQKKLQWASDSPSPIVSRVMEAYGIGKKAKILELGCGEGRDAIHLLEKGWNLTATDISPEAIRYCRERWPEYSSHFRILDCLGDRQEDTYDFIYAVAVIHMLVEDGDRMVFYRFLREHLTDGGMALICTMGDGTLDRKSDISAAFALQERTHGETGQKLLLAGTSCRMVTWELFSQELQKSGLTVAERGLTEAPPDFPVMMYAVLKK